MATKIKGRSQSAVSGLALHDGPDEWNNRVQVLLERGEVEQARAVAKSGLSLWPEHLPLINNLSLALSYLGQQDAAVRHSRQALALDPHNLHATANLVRYLVLQGQPDQARVPAQALKGLPAGPNEGHSAFKKAEALSYLGDDRAVVEICDAAPQSGGSRKDAWLWHLGAAAALRLGDEVRARRWWKRALVIDRSCDAARANLADLAAPPGERNGPFALKLNSWLTEQTMAMLGRQAQGDEARVGPAVRKYLEEHPALARLVPVLLERGDPDARRIAVSVALLTGTPPLLGALQEFCLGPHGTDKLRTEVVGQLLRRHAMPRGMVTLWQQGERREMLLIGSEIYFGATDEPLYESTPEVSRLSDEGVRLLREGDFVGAAAVLTRAHELAPKAVPVMNNLAMAWEQLGQHARAHALVDRLYALHPGYFFARVAKARLLMQDGDLERADAMLRELLMIEQLHVSEHAAQCSAQIELALARGQSNAASMWLKVWREVEPTHPNLSIYEVCIKRASKAKGTSV